MSDVEMYDMENPLVNNDADSTQSVNIKKYIPTTCLSATTFIFFLLWLSESQFGQGVLRSRNLNETCEWNPFLNRKCSPGLLCRNDMCIFPQEPVSNNTLQCYCGNNITSTPCPTQAIHPNSQSVYDYNEQPGYWTDAGSHGYYRTIYNIDYSGCKGICNSQKKCKMVNYQIEPRNCWMSEKYIVPSERNSGWTTAIKILHT